MRPGAVRRAPFDVPCDGGFVGLRRDGDELIGVLAVAPPPAAPVTAGLDAVCPPILPAVVAALSTRDVAPRSIDIVSHTMGCWGVGPAALAYRSLLGDLRIAAHRSVHLVVHLCPAEYSDAIRLRGGDGAGILRTALWTLRRLCAYLADQGVTARPLSAAAMSELTVGLTEGISVDHAVSPEPAPERCAGPALTAYRWSGTDPRRLSALLATPGVAESLSTTVTLRLCAAPSGPRLQVLVRDNGGPPGYRRGEPDLCAVTDGRYDAIRTGLPVRVAGPAPGAAVPTAAQSAVVSGALLSGTTVPLAGAGQLVGAGEDGTPVTMRLAGPGIARCDLVGDTTLGRQVAVRLAALGVPVAVASDDLGPWARLATTVGDGLIGPVGAQATARVLFDETHTGLLTAPPGSTLIRRHPVGSLVRSGPGPIVRSRDDAGMVDVEGAGRRRRARLVSTAAERVLVETE